MLPLLRYLPRPDRVTMVMGLMGLVAALIVFLRDGADAVFAGLDRGVTLLIGVIPLIAGAILLAGLLNALVPKELVSRWLGSQSGWRGLLLASIVGMATPGGPFASFPIVYGLYRAGADIGAMVAFLTAWSVIGLQRMLIWELPLLGWEIAWVRFVVSIPLPFIAGYTARWLVNGPIGRWTGALREGD